MATSWLIMLIPYFVPIVILAVLHLMDRRHGFARPATAALRQETRESRASIANGHGRQVA